MELYLCLYILIFQLLCSLSLVLSNLDNKENLPDYACNDPSLTTDYALGN